MADERVRSTLLRSEPVFLVADIASTMAWYREALGFTPDPFPPAPRTTRESARVRQVPR